LQLFGKPADYFPPWVYSPDENKSSLKVCKAKRGGGVKSNYSLHPIGLCNLLH